MFCNKCNGDHTPQNEKTVLVTVPPDLNHHEIYANCNS